MYYIISMLEFIQFDPTFFFVTFSIGQVISLKFPDLKFFFETGKRRVRIHHAYAGGILALLAFSYPVFFSIGLGAFLQDIVNHSLQHVKKWLF